MKKKILYTNTEVFEILDDSGEIPHFISSSIFVMIAEPSQALTALSALGINCDLIIKSFGPAE